MLLDNSCWYATIALAILKVGIRLCVIDGMGPSLGPPPSPTPWQAGEKGSRKGFFIFATFYSPKGWRRRVVSKLSAFSKMPSQNQI